jgi:hypothetical protein
MTCNKLVHDITHKPYSDLQILLEGFLVWCVTTKLKNKIIPAYNM